MTVTPPTLWRVRRGVPLDRAFDQRQTAVLRGSVCSCNSVVRLWRRQYGDDSVHDDALVIHGVTLTHTHIMSSHARTHTARYPALPALHWSACLAAGRADRDRCHGYYISPSHSHPVARPLVARSSYCVATISTELGLFGESAKCQAVQNVNFRKRPAHFPQLKPTRWQWSVWECRVVWVGLRKNMLTLCGTNNKTKMTDCYLINMTDIKTFCGACSLFPAQSCRKLYICLDPTLVFFIIIFVPGHSLFLWTVFTVPPW